jgi:hypothetical protein
MAAASDYLENKVIDHVLGKGARNFTSPAALFVALSKTSFTDTGTGGTELTGGSYARQAVTFNAASGGIATNTADLSFTNLNGVSSTPISHMGIFDASTGGNLLFHGALTTSKTVADGEDAVIRAGQLTVALQ